MAVTLMEEADRDWSAPEVLGEYMRRGTPVHGVDPSNVLRAAFADAKKRGMIFSTAVGRYKASKWRRRTGPTTHGSCRWMSGLRGGRRRAS